MFFPTRYFPERNEKYSKKRNPLILMNFRFGTVKAAAFRLIKYYRKFWSLVQSVERRKSGSPRVTIRKSSQFTHYHNSLALRSPQLVAAAAAGGHRVNIELQVPL